MMILIIDYRSTYVKNFFKLCISPCLLPLPNDTKSHFIRIITLDYFRKHTLSISGTFVSYNVDET